jgi:hypothetical protein
MNLFFEYENLSVKLTNFWIIINYSYLASQLGQILSLPTLVDYAFIHASDEINMYNY